MAQASFSGDGLICANCEMLEQQRELGTAGGSWSTGTLSPLAWGVISLFCNFLMLPSIFAITGGLRDLRAIGVEGDQGGRKAGAIAAIVLGAMHPVMILGVLMFGGLMMVVQAALPPRSPYPEWQPSSDDDLYTEESFRDEEPEPEPAPSTSIEDFGDRVVVHADEEVLLDLTLHDAALHASELHLRPFVYLHAQWCGPCNAVAQYADDPRMEEAFAGTYVVEVDIDRFDDPIARGAMDHGIPAWIALDDGGRPTRRMITGAAWGENIPENMAGPLEEFFSAGGRLQPEVIDDGAYQWSRESTVSFAHEDARLFCAFVGRGFRLPTSAQLRSMLTPGGEIRAPFEEGAERLWSVGGQVYETDRDDFSEVTSRAAARCIRPREFAAHPL
jgi:hypothetical protein